MNQNYMFGTDEENNNEILCTSLIQEQVNKLKKIVTFSADQENSGIPTGYTYIGQMIAHEIVPSTLVHKSGRSKKIIDPIMNLKSLYEHSDKAVDLFNDAAEFHVKKITENNNIFEDLNRDENGNAVIPEPRNDENIIISQLHLFWQKIHNKIIKLKFKDDINNESSASGKKILKKYAIERTREYVVHIFNNLIIDDYLKQLCHKNIYGVYCENKHSYIYNETNKLNQIPNEFSMAAFRFGHSMIRDSYKLINTIDGNSDTKFDGLFIKKESKNIHLSFDQVIKWGAFFEDYNKTTAHQSAFRIDTKITDGMKSIPNHDSGHNNIITINLTANLNKKIKSGKSVYREILKIFEQFKDKGTDDERGVYMQLIREDYKNKILNTIKNIEDTGTNVPLWVYILIESENELVLSDTKTKGLGIVGSFIICEVIMASIKKYQEQSMKTHLNEIDAFIKKEILKGQVALKMGHLINFIGD